MYISIYIYILDCVRQSIIDISIIEPSAALPCYHAAHTYTRSTRAEGRKGYRSICIGITVWYATCTYIPTRSTRALHAHRVYDVDDGDDDDDDDDFFSPGTCWKEGLLFCHGLGAGTMRSAVAGGGLRGGVPPSPLAIWRVMGKSVCMQLTRRATLHRT